MADSFVKLPDDATNTGKQVYTHTTTTGDGTVHKHVFDIDSPIGQTVMASSVSVALASDQSAIPVTPAPAPGVNVGDIGAILTSVTPGTGAGHLGKQIYSSSSFSDTGVLMVTHNAQSGGYFGPLSSDDSDFLLVRPAYGSPLGGGFPPTLTRDDLGKRAGDTPDSQDVGVAMLVVNNSGQYAPISQDISGGIPVTLVTNTFLPPVKYEGYTNFVYNALTDQMQSFTVEGSKYFAVVVEDLATTTTWDVRAEVYIGGSSYKEVLSLNQGTPGFGVITYTTTPYIASVLRIRVPANSISASGNIRVFIYATP